MLQKKFTSFTVQNRFFEVLGSKHVCDSRKVLEVPSNLNLISGRIATSVRSQHPFPES